MSTDVAASTRTIPLPKGATLRVDGRTLIARGPRGVVRRAFPSDLVKLSVKGDQVTLSLLRPSRRKKDRALLGTWTAHAANLAVGVTLGFQARLKVVAAHFPMKVSAKEGKLLIENFLGEKHPRTASLVPGVIAAVEEDIVILTGRDVEEVGQSAANIERTTHIRDYDPRVFQDGIYLIERARPRTEAA